PMWIYTNAQADEGTKNELLAILSEAIAENPHLAVNAQTGFVESVLTRFANEQKLSLCNHGTLNVYSAEQVRSVPPVGKLIVAEAEYKQEIADLIQIAAIDDNDGELTDEQALQFAEAHAGTGNLFLWQDGEIVSMARIVRYGKRFARITSVVTKREMRGKGYAKMLVGELAKRVLAEGLIPVLYARAENPSSNSCYSHLGFEKNGEICEFRFK
ncbi:MAG: GNAT family N-acetyltransferase, partial [Clostridia bacterium]|nr:GNAT family N-acetyltransferase [Clostridia bacterium]